MGDAVDVGVGVSMAGKVAVGVGVSVAGGVGVDVGSGVAVSVGAGLGVAVGTVVAVSVGPGVSVGVGVGVKVGSGVGVAVAVGSGMGVGVRIRYPLLAKTSSCRLAAIRPMYIVKLVPVAVMQSCESGALEVVVAPAGLLDIKDACDLVGTEPDVKVLFDPREQVGTVALQTRVRDGCGGRCCRGNGYKNRRRRLRRGSGDRGLPRLAP